MVYVGTNEKISCSIPKTNGDGISDSKTIFLPENYQTAVQLDDADLSDSTDVAVSHRYLWTPQNQDKLLADVTPTETLWTLTDHLGTIRDIIQQTPTGLIQKIHVIYDAYGNVLICKDANGTDVSNPVIFGFTGKYFDTDTQLQNNVNRWYDSIIGRWLSTDPIDFEGNDTNLYRYVGNGILKYNDVLGLQTIVTKCSSLLGPYRQVIQEFIKNIPGTRKKGIQLNLDILFNDADFHQGVYCEIKKEGLLVSNINDMLGFSEKTDSLLKQKILNLNSKNSKCGYAVEVRFIGKGYFHQCVSDGEPWYEFLYQYCYEISIDSEVLEKGTLFYGAIRYEPPK